jgi:hypothetical protein
MLVNISMSEPNNQIGRFYLLFPYNRWEIETDRFSNAKSW